MLKKFLLILILVVGACAPIEPQPPSAFDVVCAALEADNVASCEGVYEPEIIVTILIPVLMPQLHGMTVYDEARIFVNAEASVPLDTIIIHEMIHWITRNGTLEPPSKCESEALARKYTEIITGHPPGDWRANYGCEKGTKGNAPFKNIYR